MIGPIYNAARDGAQLSKTNLTGRSNLARSCRCIDSWAGENCAEAPANVPSTGSNLCAANNGGCDRGSASRGVKGVFDPPWASSYLLTRGFIVKFGGHLPPFSLFPTFLTP
jgi:hypothetical protein